MKQKRKNIALLVANITDPFSNAVARGAMIAAKELNINLTIFPGKYLGIQDKYDYFDTSYEYQHSVLFDHAAKGEFDYIIAAVGTIAYALNNEQKKEFLNKFKDTPVLSVAAEVDGYDSLCFDNKTGMIEAVETLISEGYKHIGVMVGDLRNFECKERFDAVVEILRKHNRILPDEYIMESDLSECCEKEISELLDKAPDIDAIVCINDAIAEAVIKELNKRDKKIGKEIAVTGFDDLPLCGRMIPNLATIRADARGLGMRAVKIAYNYLEGNPIHDKKYPTKFIKRGSCVKDINSIKREDSGIEVSENVPAIRHADNIFIRDSMMFSADLKTSYAKAMRQLSLIGGDTGFIYTFDEPIQHKFNNHFPEHLNWLFKSYSYGSQTYVVDRKDMKMTTPEVFNNKYLCEDRQRCFVAISLYVADKQYGLALIEPRNFELFEEIELITYIMSSIVRTLYILQKNEELIEQLHSKTLALETESKIDMLTGAFNRRGFYLAAEDIISSEDNNNYIVCYADLDNLKIINDVHGHNEGDYSLRLTVECLKQTFGNDAIIGRFGGDEYAVICKKQSENVQYYRDKIKNFIDDFNLSKEKPYHFGISIGIVEKDCNDIFDIQEALDKADGLLYIQKRHKKII